MQLYGNFQISILNNKKKIDRQSPLNDDKKLRLTVIEPLPTKRTARHHDTREPSLARAKTVPVLIFTRV